MKLTVLTSDEKLITLGIGSEESVWNLKALLELETGVPLRRQQLQFYGYLLKDSYLLSSVGIREGDVLVMTDSQSSITESQKETDEAILAIKQNRKAALEYNPEGFAKVFLLYVDIEVNGVPVKAIIDTGSQTTLISKNCAKRCGLLGLVDQNYKCFLHGIGQREILGRIYLASIKIGHQFYHGSLNVLDDPFRHEFIFGLDMLRKLQCVIDLSDNVLRVGDGELSVPLLQEKDIPKLSRLSNGGEQSEGTSTVQEKIPRSVALRQQIEAKFEAKIKTITELEIGGDAAIQALELFKGNEKQAIAFLFGA